MSSSVSPRTFHTSTIANARALTPVAPRTTTHSSLFPLGLENVQITGGEWREWQEDNRDVTIPHVLAWLEKDGTVDNLRRLNPASGGLPERRGLWFTDSDLYKHLEGIAWENGRRPSAELQAILDEMASIISAAQDADGYLNSFVQADLDVRWDNLVKSHEHYCVGHLVQAAVADARARPDSPLLPPTIRAVECIVRDFGNGARNLVDGHEEIEMALVELYRLTGRDDFLSLARQFIDDRGHRRMKSDEFDSAYFQDAIPVREQTDVTGHAVRAVYLLAGMVDVYLETGDRPLLDAALTQWESMTTRKSYLTGALGSRFEGEAFGDAFELPPDLGYGETCATIGNVMTSWRLLLATGEGRFADAIERGLYNLFSASTNLERTGFFYNNPAQRRSQLPAAPTDVRPKRAAAPGTRPVWFECACCPPNIVRTIASLGAYVATNDANGIQIHQYMPATIATDNARLEVTTRYPLEGVIDVAVHHSREDAWTLSLRVPAWAPSEQVIATVWSNTEMETLQAMPDERGYLRIHRTWSAGDRVQLTLPLAVRLTVSHPAIDALRGTVAVERGPLVYALESPDQLPGVDINVAALAVDRPLDVSFEVLLGREVAVIRGTGLQMDSSGWDNAAYVELGHEPPTTSREVSLAFIPYALWANRGPSVMRIHLPAGRADSEA